MSVEDKLAIIEKINLYGFAVDTQCWDLFDQIFTQDVDAFYSDSESSFWDSLEKFKLDFTDYHAPLTATQHVMSGHLINLKGDLAYALTYGSWRLLRKGLDGGEHWEGTGWYDDVFVQTADGWRIKSRSCRTIWWSGNTRVIEAVPGLIFPLPMDAMKDERLAGRIRYFESLKG